MSGEDELYRELVHLRHGRGVHEPRLAEHLGPMLRELSGLAPDDPDGLARERVRALLRELVADLPADLATAAVHALALGPRPAGRLTRRTEAFAAEIHTSERTARRRMDEAARLMARAALIRADPVVGVDPDAEDDPGEGWRAKSCTVLLRLDTPTPELYETRTVQAERMMSELTVRLDLPPAAPSDGPAGPLEVEAVYGALITDIDPGPEGRHYRITVALPQTLKPSDQTEFCLHYRVPPDQPIRDHCALVPLEECDHGRVRVRFDRSRPPAAVWRLWAVPPRQMDRATTFPGAERLEPDAIGEVGVSFRGLRQEHGYGVAWRNAQESGV